MTQTTSILQIQSEFLGDFDRVKNCDYKLTEISQAFADLDKLAKAEPGRQFRLVNVTISVIAEKVANDPFIAELAADLGTTPDDLYLSAVESVRK